MANEFAKKSIDFDVYERADPESQIDWGKEAKVISDAFGDIAKDRTQRKAAVEKSFADQQAALNDLGEYDNPTAQQVMANAGQDGANKLLDVKNLVKRGLMKPSDGTMFQQNQLNGFNLLKKNMGAFDKTFQEYTERVQSGEGAPAEQYLATLTEGFANLNDLSVQTDPETGNVSLLRLDAQGNPVEGGDSMTVNRLTLLMKQKVNNFDLGKEVVGIQDEMGTITTQIATDMAGPNVKLTKEMVSRAETEFVNSEKGQEFLDGKVAAIMANPMDVNSMIMNYNMKTDNGTAYSCGSQEDYDNWMKENDNDEANNPILVIAFGKDNQYAAEFNDTQTQKVKDLVTSQITGSLDYEKTENVKGLNQTQQPSAASISKAAGDKKLLAQGKNLLMAVSGDVDESEAGMSYLVDASNGNISGMQKTANGFIVTYPPSADGTPVDPYEKNTEGMTPEESMRAMWKASGLSDSEFDAWLDAGGSELLEDAETTRDPINAAGPQRGIKYDRQSKVTNSDGNEVSAVDFIVDGPLGKSPSSLEFNTNAEFINEYSNLLNQESFFPKGIGAGKITMDGDTMTFSIGGTPYIIGDVFGQNTTETVAIIQEKIQEAIAKRSQGQGGGGASKHNKKKE